MKKLFSIGETAKMVGMTTETLRHYDRIGLVKPSKTDDFTSYRYYNEQDIVLLNTIKALQLMDLPLKKIKEALEYNDIEKIIALFNEAEQKADEKIALIEYSKAKIQKAKQDFENKLKEQEVSTDCFVRYFDERTILLSDGYEMPTLDNLWNYLSHYYDKIPTSQREQFAFEDMAGIYSDKEQTRLFAVCIRYQDIDGLKKLPSGNYLCANCAEDTRAEKTKELMQIAKDKYNAEPSFVIHKIVLSGILQWTYQVQLYIENLEKNND